MWRRELTLAAHWASQNHLHVPWCKCISHVPYKVFPTFANPYIISLQSSQHTKFYGSDCKKHTRCQARGGSLQCRDCSGSRLNFFNLSFQRHGRTMNFLDVLSVQTKICANESNLTLIHSHNIELNWATKGRRKQGRNGLVSCPRQIREKITKNCTSSSSSPMLFSTSHVLEWKSVVKNCRWLSSFARRQNKKGYCSWKVASSIWPCIVPYIGSKPFKVSPITLLNRSRMIPLLKIPHHLWYFFIRVSVFDTCKEIKKRKSLSSSGWR